MAIGNDFQLDMVANAQALDKSIKAVTTTKTYKIKIEADGTQTKTLAQSTEKLANAQGQLLNVTTKYNKEGQVTSAVVKDMSKNVKGLGADFVSTLGKVAKFGAVTALIGAFTASITEAFQTVKKLDDSLTELQKVSDEAKSNLSGFTDQAFELAEAMSTSASNVTDAVTEFSKSGYGLQDSLQLAEQAMVFQTIADDAVSASDSATMLIQTMKAYNMTASDSEHIISALNEVSNNYAVSSTDLSQSIGKVASVANLAGVDFEHLLGLMTASTEVTQNASKSANGYKTILTNLMTKDLEKQFNEFGLSMRDTNGALKDGYQIIEELSSVYKKLGTTWSEDDDAMVSMNDNFNALMEDIAGKHNINVLVAGLQNFDQAINATNSALNSAGSAQEEFDTAMGGLTKKLEGLKGQFQELVWGDGGLNNFLKGLVDLGTGILKVINDIGGLSTILISLIGILITLKGEAVLGGIVSIFSKLPILLNNVGAIFLALTTKGASLSLTLKNIGISASIAQLALGALTAVITIGVIAWNKYKQAQEDAKNSALDNINSLDSYTSSLQSTIDKINDESTSKSALIDIASKLDSSYDSEKAQLKDINELRQEAIDKLYEEAQAKAKETIRKTGAQYQKSKDYLSSTITSKSGVPISGTPEEVYKGMGEQLDYYNQKVQEGEEISKAGQRAAQSLADEYSSLGTNIKDATTIVDGYDEAQKTSNQSQEEWLNTAKESSDSIQLQSGELQSLAEQYNLTSEQIDAISQAMENSDASAYEIAESLGYIKDETNQAKEALEEYKDALSELSSMSDSFTTLNDAIAEYNSSGEFTLDTLDKLLSLGDEYLSLLEFENGQVSLNKEGALALANAKIDEAEATAVQKAMAELNALAQNDEANAIDNASESASASYNANMTAVSGVNQAIIACNKGVTAWNSYWSAQSKKAISNGASASKANEIGKSLNNQLKTLESLRGNLGKVTTATTSNTRATGGNTSAKKDNTDATKAQTDALKAQKEELEDEIDKYEQAINYILDLLDEDIEKLEEARDIEIDALEAEIDKIKEKQDAIETSVNEQISLYEEEKKVREDFWDSEIDKIKESSDALDDRIERQKLLDNLTNAKKKKVLVYTENGFEYQQDQEALTKAQQELANYDAKKNKEEHIKALEEKKEAESKIYDDEIDDLNDYLTKLKKTNDDEIADLNAHIKKVKSKYNKKINYLKDYKKNFEDQTKAYKKAQDKLLAEQLTGINFENSNWKTRISNLNTFVKNYNEKLASVEELTKKLNLLADKAEADAQRIDSASSSASGGGSSTTTDTTTEKKNGFKGVVKYTGEYDVQYKGKTYRKGSTIEFTGSTANDVASQIKTFLNGDGKKFFAGMVSQSGGINAYASGISSIGENQIAIVGDNPSNNELAIGSKLNGSLMNLSKGSGVVNAKSTNTLAGILNNLSSMRNGYTSNLALSAQGMNLYIDSLNLPQVSDGIGFVEYIKSNAKSLAIQYGSKR